MLLDHWEVMVVIEMVVGEKDGTTDRVLEDTRYAEASAADSHIFLRQHTHVGEDGSL